MNAKFQKNRLPNPLSYFEKNGLNLIGKGEWRSAICPFHKDTEPSLRVRVENGAFRCLACGEKGGDIVAFHQKRFGMPFKDACIALGAWGQS